MVIVVQVHSGSPNPPYSILAVLCKETVRFLQVLFGCSVIFPHRKKVLENFPGTPTIRLWFSMVFIWRCQMVFRRVLVLSCIVFFLTNCESKASYSTCGNGQLEDGEDCDGNMFGSADSCLALGFQGGILSCSTLCEPDVSQCIGCSLFGPFSGCPDAQSCMLQPQDGSVACMVPGSSQENQMCESTEQCAAGLVCMFRTCSRLCRDKDRCSERHECHDPGWPDGVGFCPAQTGPCDPVSQDGCAAGTACYITGMDGSLGCWPPKDARLNEICDASDYCAPGLVCAYGMTNTCRQLCRLDSDCDQGSCTAWTGWSNGLGFCL